ncbi:hypothetical protein Pan44_08450 [Caulifigura coniformis]|uniref:3-keto-alpha-glucoside-1,2-lyase/3-keto-2-hydroxy-glucal hydratase domain-containing protein n=1 Tax=Caulifigura coniformis TaxID=2527983 RepID=A0A517S9P5_9PLAN|nr:DUF1080 domain-containing protein [Caulifigura coniformis]QDT52832.1 hypothetical protein Pan44_08450 [Caulifigura coniformis]
MMSHHHDRLLLSRGLALVVIATLLPGCSRDDKGVTIAPAGLSEDQALELAAEASASAVPADREGFRPLHLRDFQMFAAEPDSWREESGMILTTGKPKGYISSRRVYRNFTWRAEFRFPPGDDPSKADQSNTGFMLCIQEPHKVWPRSLEVQGKWIEMGQIKSNGGVPALMINDDQAAREAARKPVGEWNAIEITVKDGTVSSILNGKAICIAEPGELKSGRIGLQAENFPVEFRGVRIRED